MRPTKYAVFAAAFLLLAAVPSVPNAVGIFPAVTGAAEEAPQITERGSLSETVSWQLDSAGTLTVTGSGDMSDVTGNFSSYSRKIKSAVIRNTDNAHTLTAIGASLFSGCSSLTKVTLPDTITVIGNAAFSGCTALNSCNFPASLTQIGDSAFYNTALTELTLPGCALGAYAFSHCGALKAVEIKNGTESIPEHCFSWCQKLESVVLPDTVKQIESGGAWDYGAFYYCNNLKKVSIGSGIESIHEDAFRTRGSGLEVTFREGVTAVPANAFKGRTELTKVVLPETLTAIGENAFSGCSGLSTCMFPDSLTEIGNAAFYDTALTDVKLPGCTLGAYAFSHGRALKTVEIKNGTVCIPEHCFSWCQKLESVVLPDTVKRIECGDAWDYGAFYYCNNLKKVSIGADIESIHEDAFRTRGSGLEITFREGVTAIPAGSFNGRSEVTKLVLPETLRSIGANAFSGCSELSTCIFPDSLKQIGNSAFYNTALTDVKLPGCTLGAYAFSHGRALKTVEIKNGTECIPEQCFSWCQELESVVLPDTVKRIECGDAWDYGAFYYCTNLKKVSIGAGIESIHEDAFRTRGSGLEITFREGVTAIPAGSFNGRSEVTKLVLPETLRSIGANAFSGCSGLSTCVFPDSLEQIGDSAFYGTALTELTLPGCTLGTYAFSHCGALKTLTIKNGTECIPEQCFSWCQKLESVVLPDSVKRIECGDAWDYGAFYYCTNLQKVSIGAGIERIDADAFRTRGEAMEVTFREGVTTLPDFAFNSAPVTKIILPETLTELSENAVSGCSSLKQISIASADCVIADSERTIPSAARICGLTDSTAQKYAEKYNRIFENLQEEELVIAYGNCVTGVSLSLDGRLGVNFYVKLSSKAAKVVLTGPGGSVEYSGSRLNAAMQSDGSYKCTFGVNAVQAGEKVSLKVYDERGKLLDIYNSAFEKVANRRIDYSVNDYIADAPKYENNAKLKAMVTALDQFCKAAENYFCHKGYALNIQDADVTKTNSFNKQFKISLVLNSGTALRIYSDAETAVRVKGTNSIPLEAVRVNATTQYYEIPDINAFNLLENETIILDNVTYTVCPTDYCALILARNDSSRDLRTVCSALYYYGKAAQAYTQNTEQ